MNFGEFFKPTKGKIIFTTLLFLFFPVKNELFTCLLDDLGSSCGLSWIPLGGLIKGFKLINGNFNNFLNELIPILIMLVVSYLLVCIIVKTYTSLKSLTSKK